MEAIATSEDSFTESSRRSSYGVIYTFVACVIVPTVTYSAYASFIQTPRYVAHAQMIVRGARQLSNLSGSGASGVDSSTILSKLGSVGEVKASSQDAYIVQNYIRSAAIVADMGDQAYMSKHFGGRDVDWTSRVSTNASIEQLVRYWRKRTAVSIDTVNNIISLNIEGFTPQDSLSVTQDVLRLSEKIINDISLRTRRDALRRNEAEVALQADRLAAARARLTTFRNQSMMLDPESSAKSVTEVLTKLTLDKIDVETQLAATGGALAPDSPTGRLLRARLETLVKQIAEQRALLTDAASQDTVSAQLATFEQLKLEGEFAERLYVAAERAYNVARVEAERQQLFLTVTVPPQMPELATQPEILANTILVFASLTTLWGILALLVASVQDQRV